jgi:nucleotide-binding universal stress UspA family protein
MYSTILWAADGAADATDVLDEAVRLLEPDGKLVVFHVEQLYVGSHVGGLPIYPDEPERGRRLAEVVEDLCDRGIDAELWIESTVHSPVRSIPAAAFEVGADAVVCGARARHSPVRSAEGSVSSRLIHEVTIPVVVVPQSAVRRVGAPA